tara:strand:+ start:1354 stop:2295 length:942 start_codon:yes stop_codon:yes gene_type:complete
MDNTVKENNNKALAVFIHIGNCSIFNKIKNYLLRINNIKYDLYLNINCFDKSKSFNDSVEKSCKLSYPNCKIFRFENRGCDIGPFLLFLDYLRIQNISYKWIMKLHTKTDEILRNQMLDHLLPTNFIQYYQYLIKNNICIDGKSKYPYDYVNVQKDINNIRMLKLHINTSWEPYLNNCSERHKEELSNLDALSRYYYIRKNNLSLDLIPEIDIDLYNYLFKKQVQNNIITGNEKFDIIKQIVKYNKIKNNLWYYPGTMFICKYEVFQKAFQQLDYQKIFNSLEEGKLNDDTLQSNTHSWERILPIIFQRQIMH